MPGNSLPGAAVSFPGYPRYRTIDTLSVPEHWRTARLRRLVTLNPSKSELRGVPENCPVSFLPMEAIGEDGSLDLSRERPIAEVESGYSYFKEGDLAIAKITPCFENGKAALMRGLTNGAGFGTTELIVMRPHAARLLPKFLLYLVQSSRFRELGEASMYGAGGQKRVPDDFVRGFQATLPPLLEQAAIAAFLDRETAKIDALIAEQERLIELLAEQRLATISHAVTKGWELGSAMVSSGIDHIGLVPPHWRLTRLKALFRQTKRQDHSDKTVLSVYREFGVIDKSSRSDNINKTPEDLSAYQLVQPGDLVVNKMKSWQGSLGISDIEGITSPDYAVFAPIHSEESAFLHYLLRSQGMVSIYRSISNGIRLDQWRLEPDKFLSLHAYLPPVDEQRSIVHLLRARIAQNDRLAGLSLDAIALLRARRSALISSAVTGQIDVRGLSEPEAA